VIVELNKMQIANFFHYGQKQEIDSTSKEYDNSFAQVGPEAKKRVDLELLTEKYTKLCKKIDWLVEKTGLENLYKKFT